MKEIASAFVVAVLALILIFSVENIGKRIVKYVKNSALATKEEPKSITKNNGVSRRNLWISYLR